MAFEKKNHEVIIAGEFRESFFMLVGIIAAIHQPLAKIQGGEELWDFNQRSRGETS